MNIYRHTDIYRQNYRHVGSPNDLVTGRIKTSHSEARTSYHLFHLVQG